MLARSNQSQRHHHPFNPHMSLKEVQFNWGIGAKKVLRVDDQRGMVDRDCVSYYLQDGDELFVELTSFDIWLRLDIRFNIHNHND
jgi:hypothetical protein